MMFMFLSEGWTSEEGPGHRSDSPNPVSPPKPPGETVTGTSGPIPRPWNSCSQQPLLHPQAPDCRQAGQPPGHTSHCGWSRPALWNPCTPGLRTAGCSQSPAGHVSADHTHTHRGPRGTSSQQNLRRREGAPSDTWAHAQLVRRERQRLGSTHVFSPGTFLAFCQLLIGWG